ncbi:MAG: oligosaccharide flippase family protein [Ignavibacteriales bacterium]|nr:oligosaccharide flippase family protein [Ignavibacteriales bacterium]
MSLTKKIFFNSSAAIISIAGGLLRNKIFAAYLSVSLFGILSISQQAMSLLFTVFAFGLPLGITAFAADISVKNHAEQREQISRIVILVLMLSVLSLAILCLVLLLDPIYISKLITNSSVYSIPVSLILLSAPLMVVENCLFGILEGMGNLKGVVVFKIIPAIIVLPLIYFLVSDYFILGAAIGMVVNEIILIIAGFYLLRDKLKIKFDSFRVLNVFIPIIKVAALSLAAGIAWMAADFIIKRYMLGLLGESSNAIIQSVAKITDLYPTVALSWLTMHLFPAIASLRDNKQSAAELIHRTLLVAVSIVIPVIIILFTSRDLILKILYTSDFVIAYDYLGAMLVIGILKVYSWVIGVALLPLSLKREWFYSVMIQVAIYVITIYIGITNNIGIYSIPIAFGISLASQIVYTLFIFHRNNLIFNTNFLHQSMIFFVISILFMLSMYQTLFIIPIVIIFLYFILRYGLIKEIAEKVYNFRGVKIERD